MNERKLKALADKYGRCDQRIKQLEKIKENLRKEVLEEIKTELGDEESTTIAGRNFFLEVSAPVNETVLDVPLIWKTLPKKTLREICSVKVTELRNKVADFANYATTVKGSRKLTAKPIKIGVV